MNEKDGRFFGTSDTLKPVEDSSQVSSPDYILGHGAFRRGAPFDPAKSVGWQAGWKAAEASGGRRVIKVDGKEVEIQ